MTVGDIRKGCGKGQRAVRLYLDIVQGNAAVCAVAVDQRTVLERLVRSVVPMESGAFVPP
ncbi:MAG: hypothetical protein ACLUOF_11295 [Ruminococcus sp.]